MSDNVGQLWTEANRALQAQRPLDAACYLAELVTVVPNDRLARLSLALAVGDSGNPVAALKIMMVLAERLVHEGYMLPAIVVIRHALHHAGEDPRLLQLLAGLHVRGVRARAGNLVVPPPLKPKKTATNAVSAAALLAQPIGERMTKVAAVGAELPPAGPAAAPQPMPLFCELETPAFVETVKRLHYRRVLAGTKILEEGAAGDSLLILVSGQVSIAKGGVEVTKLGPGSVLGEMALITNAPRSATATATEQVEFFELSRADVSALSKSQPKVLQELVDYCRRRLILNLLRTSPLFSQFDEPTRIRLLGRFQTVTFSAGQEVIAQGEQGTGLYVIATGNCQVQITNDAGETVIVATLGPGQCFGEISLLRNQPTTASVLAQNTVGALALPAADFQAVLQEYPKVRPFLEGLTADRLKASREAAAAGGLVDPDDVVVL